MTGCSFNLFEKQKNLRKNETPKGIQNYSDLPEICPPVLLLTVDGAWGSLGDFQPDQSIYLMATTNEKKELVGVHALADDLSMQAMSRPYMLKEYDKKKGRLVFSDETARKAPLDLKTNRKTKFLTEHGETIKAGNVFYCNMLRRGSDRTVTELLDTSAFETRRSERLQKQRDDLTIGGLLATILDIDGANHQIGVMVRRSDAWYARSLKTNDVIALKSQAQEKISCRVADVHPDYSRIRLRLEFAGSIPPKVQPGGQVALFTKLPDRINFETPPDLGRFTDRQERIDYLLSTLYCPCGMMGDSCAGHWNTLAACKLHGCGMPNLISELAGKWIDAGKSDAAILAELVQRNGKNILTPHQNPPPLGAD